MSREVRMVPPGWQHPTEWGKDWRTGQPKLRFKPLFAGPFGDLATDWDKNAAKWEEGFLSESFLCPDSWVPKDPSIHTGTYAEWAGSCPKEEDYMPEFAPGTATHYMMYETTSEGTPISPAFATPEELAHWLADNHASAFRGEDATYEQWLRVCKGGYAPSAVSTENGFTSDVARLTGMRNLGKRPHDSIVDGPRKTYKQQQWEDLILNVGSFGVIIVGALIGLFLFGVLPALLVR